MLAGIKFVVVTGFPGTALGEAEEASNITNAKKLVIRKETWFVTPLIAIISTVKHIAVIYNQICIWISQGWLLI